MLRVFENGEIVTTRLAFTEASWRSIDAVAGPGGELAVVAAPSDRTGVMTMVVDPSRPEPSAHRIPGTATVVPDPGVQLIATGGRFAATWIDAENHAVRLAEFDRRRVLPVVTVADAAGGTFPLLALVHAPGEEPRDVAVLWSGNDGSVMMRRLPEPVTGSLRASELLAWLAERLDRLVSRR